MSTPSPTAASSAPILEARRLTKRFPGVIALREVAFDLRAGEIHALCGENGAGKSTLIKLLSGLHAHGSYEGELLVDGTVAQFTSIRDAETAGISVIYQELALVDEMTVAENIFLGREPKKGLRIDWGRMHREAAALIAQFGLPISPEARIGDLGVGHKQLVEIVRALGKKSRVLVLDEPTAALTEQEVAVLLDILKRLRAQGTACIYISHKLDEVFAVADRITVLRDGQSITTLPAAEATIPLVIKHMVGREITDLFPRQAPKGRAGPLVPPGSAEVSAAAATSGSADSRHSSFVDSAAAAPVLRVRHLTVAPSKGHAAFLRDISFDLRPGEVLGFGGLMGAGRTELLMHLFGAWGHRLGGEVELRGTPFPKPAPREAIQRGLVLVSEDRKRYGLVLDQPISFNLSLSSLAQYTRFTRINQSAEYVGNKKYFDSLRVKAPGQHARVGGLSGGNQQKVVIGKALMTRPTIVMLDEPTRGIDVGAKLEVYQLMNQLTDEGKAVILVSSELPELMGMSDRVIMLHEGEIGGEFIRSEFSQERLLAAAMGKHERAAVA